MLKTERSPLYYFLAVFIFAWLDTADEAGGTSKYFLINQVKVSTSQ